MIIPFIIKKKKSLKRFIYKIRAVFHIVFYKLGLTKKPIALRWNITSGCPKRCNYCNNDLIAAPEPTFEEIKMILNNIIDSKPSRISISGGEPLTSKHFDFIVSSLVDSGISVIMNTSGLGIEQRKNFVAKLDLVQFSLDGDPFVCDQARGKGTYQKVMDAIEICKNLDVKFTFATTLSRDNLSLETVDYMLNLAEKYKTVVAFQPVKRVWGMEEDFDTTAPSPLKMQEVIKYLIKLKKEGNKHIRNSLVGLKHVSAWPNFPELECTGGKMFAVIQSDGNLVACDRIDSSLSRDVNLKNDKLIPALKNMPAPNCDGCGFCGATELNYLNQLDLSIIPSLRKL